VEEQETIDVLMATYNGEKYIKEQIESILNQTYKNIHLIISDDGSKDNTVQILKEYENKDKRVTVYVQKQNLGYIKNFEFLLTKIENDIYMLSDQDDVWKVDKIENTYNKLKEDIPELDINIMQDSFADRKWIETIKKGCTKYKAISELADYLNINNDEIIAFGDGLNDIDMLKKCGTGVALSNALPVVKENANFVTIYNHNHDGVIEFLREYLNVE